MVRWTWHWTDDAGVKVLLHTGAATSTTFAAPVNVFTQTPMRT